MIRKMNESKLEIKMICISKEETHKLIYPLIENLLKKHKQKIIDRFLKDLNSGFSKKIIYNKWKKEYNE